MEGRAGDGLEGLQMEDSCQDVGKDIEGRQKRVRLLPIVLSTEHDNCNRTDYPTAAPGEEPVDNLLAFECILEWKTDARRCRLSYCKLTRIDPTYQSSTLAST